MPDWGVLVDAIQKLLMWYILIKQSAAGPLIKKLLNRRPRRVQVIRIVETPLRESRFSKSNWMKSNGIQLAGFS
jgi:hypothetical protein